MNLNIEPLKQELSTFLRELPRLLAEGNEGRFALVKGNEVVSVWDTSDDAYQAGCERYGMGPFLAQPIDPRFLDQPWPEDVLPRKAV
jgi:hypothetical protein